MVTMFKLSFFLCLTLCALCATHPNKSHQKTDGRIVGGYKTTIEEFPHQVSIRLYGIHWCGGSILKSNIIISAAHCFHDSRKEILENMKVVAGVTHTTDVGNPKHIKSVLIHEKFNKLTLANDIAIIYIKDTLIYSDQIQPIELPAPDEVLEVGTLTLVSGWGSLSENGYGPNALHYIDLPLIDSGICSKIYGAREQNILCAGYEDHDACFGDSGGPMVVGNKLVGIVSAGNGCARPNFPGVYTKVSSFRKWIDANTM